MTENTVAITEASILENIAKSFNSQIEIICTQLMDANKSVMKDTEAIILDDNIILLIKDGYGVVLRKQQDYLRRPYWGWGLHCKCCCYEVKEQLNLIVKERALRLVFSSDWDENPFGEKRTFSLEQIFSLFPSNTPFTFLQMIGFDSVGAEEEVNRYTEYLRDLILKSLGNPRTL